MLYTRNFISFLYSTMIKKLVCIRVASTGRGNSIFMVTNGRNHFHFSLEYQDEILLRNAEYEPNGLKKMFGYITYLKYPFYSQKISKREHQKNVVDFKWLKKLVKEIM